MLKISNRLHLPVSAVTRTFGILAVRGAGKTNTGAVMAEEMYAAGLPFVVIDPVGNWWGLRSSRDGSKAGLALPVFGGSHGDVPLERSAGPVFADLIAEKRLSAVFDLSGFDSEGEKKTFLLAFAKRLYQQNRDPLHLFLEEADDYIPQRPMRDEAQLLRSWENIVRRGRSRGLGMTMITQRSAALNKNVLTQVETLIAMRTTGPRDQDTIREWVRYHQQKEEVMTSLAQLEDGEAWVWSPEFLRVMERVKIRRRRTFDSGATPENLTATESRPVATMADIDLEALRGRISQTVERARENDPAHLRKRIRQLERQLQTPVPTAHDLEAARRQGFESAVHEEHARVAVIFDSLRALFQSASKAASDGLALIEKKENSPLLVAIDGPIRPTKASPQKPAITPTPAKNHRPKPAGGGQARMLKAIAQRHPRALNRDEIRVYSVIASSGGTLSTYLGRLTGAGLVEQTGGGYQVTAAGAEAAAGIPEQPDTTEQLVAAWSVSKYGIVSGVSRLLEILIDAYPEQLSREELRERAQIASTGGTLSTYIGRLTGRCLAEKVSGGFRASRILMEP